MDNLKIALSRFQSLQTVPKHQPYEVKLSFFNPEIPHQLLILILRSKTSIP